MAANNNKQPTDATFRNYSPEQAAKYAGARVGYAPGFIDYIIDYHRSTGGQTGTLLDVGCGPGTATRDLAPRFDHVTGADPGEAMIEVASKVTVTTATGAPINWRISSAEDIDKIADLPHGSVDMITAATAAHWFDMPLFWEAAAKLLKPGGTVAIWCGFGVNNNPLNPNSEQLQKLFRDFREQVLGPYTTPQNLLAQSGLEGLEMPWDREATASLFNKEISFERRWNSNEATGDEQKLFNSYSNKAWPMPAMKALTETMSPVTRWREAHPDLVDTDKDCVNVLIRQICEIMGVDQEHATLRGGMGIALFCVKRA